MIDDEYDSIESLTEATVKVKKSRFIGTAFPATNEEIANNWIAELSKKYHDATHHCYAYRLIHASQIISRCSDAGEPANTAGLPILNVVKGRNILNAGIVVTRYFGGIKLGKGGLIRAYSECAQAVLDHCRIIKHHRLNKLIVVFPNQFIGSVMHIVSLYKGDIIDSHYDQQTRLIIEIPYRHTDGVKEKLLDVTSGKVMIE